MTAANFVKVCFCEKNFSLYCSCNLCYTDEFKDQICGTYSNCVVSRLLLPDIVQPSPPARSHDLLETAKEDMRTHPQSSIELPTRELCCSSCGKSETGSCSSGKKSGDAAGTKQGVERGERESRSPRQSIEKVVNESRVGEAEGAVTDEKSSEGDAQLVDAKFSNTDDVISKDSTEASQEVKDDDNVRINTKDDIPLLESSSSVETDSKVSGVITFCTMISTSVVEK